MGTRLLQTILLLPSSAGAVGRDGSHRSTRAQKGAAGYARRYADSDRHRGVDAVGRGERQGRSSPAQAGQVHPLPLAGSAPLQLSLVCLRGAPCAANSVL